MRIMGFGQLRREKSMADPEAEEGINLPFS